MPGSLHVASQSRRVALLRGPLVYCFEQVDQAAENGRSRDPEDLEVVVEAGTTEEIRGDRLGGSVLIEARGRIPTKESERSGPISDVAAVAVPYHLRANRKPGAIRVWMH